MNVDKRIPLNVSLSENDTYNSDSFTDDITWINKHGVK